MKSRLVVMSALAGAAALLMPAHATPYAGQFRYISAGSIAVQGADGARWVLSIGATKSGSVESRAEQALYIDLSRCVGSACVSKGKWARPLTAAEISINGDFSYGPKINAPAASATLKTVLGGRNFDLNLEGNNENGGGFDPIRSTTPPGIGAKSYLETSAGGTLKIAGVTCRITIATAVIGETTLLDTVGDDARDPRTAPPLKLPAGFLSGKRPVRC